MAEEEKEIQVVEEEVSVEVKNIIEALIFASDEPLTTRTIRALVDEANKERDPKDVLMVNADIVRKAVGDLNRGYGKSGSAFRIAEIAGGFVFTTQERYASWVGKLAKEKARRRLSVTAVETLAIIAYKQPITKVEVEFIRGVNVDYIIKTLLEKDLIYISGRANTPGRPLLYGTTQKFLEHFGLNEITDLPKPREIEELIGETEAEVDRRLLAEQHQLEFKEELEEKLQGHEGTKQKLKEPKQPRVKIQAPKELAEEKKSEPTETNGTAVPSDNVNPVIPVGEVQMGEPVSEVPAESVNAEISASIVDDEKSQARGEMADSVDEIVESHEEENQPDEVIESQDSVAKPIKLFSERGVEILESRGNIETKNPDTELNPAGPIEKRVGEESKAIETNLNAEDLHNQNVQDRVQGESIQSGSGWSKWKTKVKSFFQKIFG